MDKIRTKAIAFGVINSPTDGRIIAIDPDNKHDKRQNAPLLTQAEAALAFEKGLIADPSRAKTVDDEASDGSTTAPQDDPNLLGNLAAARTAEAADDDNKGSEGATSNDSRQSTAWPDPERPLGDAAGTVGVKEDDRPSPSDDAPPAKKRGGAAKDVTLG